MRCQVKMIFRCQLTISCERVSKYRGTSRMHLLPGLSTATAATTEPPNVWTNYQQLRTLSFSSSFISAPIRVLKQRHVDVFWMWTWRSQPVHDEQFYLMLLFISLTHCRALLEKWAISLSLLCATKAELRFTGIIVAHSMFITHRLVKRRSFMVKSEDFINSVVVQWLCITAIAVHCICNFFYLYFFFIPTSGGVFNLHAANLLTAALTEQ